jgi:hypothetical protein
VIDPESAATPTRGRQRTASLLIALAPVSMGFYLGGIEVGLAVLVTFAFPVSAIWFADQFAATNANLMGVSLVNVSSRQIRTIGWVALVLGSIAFLVLSLPHAFPRAA